MATAPGVREQPGHLATRRTFSSAGRVEAEVAVEAVAHVVAVEDVGDAAALDEGALQAVRRSSTSRPPGAR